jgi:hypothetical protein
MRHSRLGYMKIDNRCSGGKLLEDDLDACRHCHATIPRSKLLVAHAHCSKCDGPLCASCGIRAMQFGCVTHDQWMTQLIKDQYRREQNAKIMGI